MGDRNYVSGELFHLVGYSHPEEHGKNYQTLKQILSDQWISYWPHTKDWGEHSVKINWDADMVKGEFLIPNITCFADIPFDCLEIHGRKYGQFGLSLDRSYLVYHDARPVIYVPYLPNDSPSISGLTLVTHLKNTFKGFEKLVVDPIPEQPDVYLASEPKTAEQAIWATSSIFLMQFLAFVKPFNATLALEDLENYYMEREWRRFGNLKLQQNCLRRIVVQPDFYETAKRDFPEFKDLLSRFPSRT